MTDSQIDGAGVLCYVRDSFAYFTTLPLLEQTGDDWNDAPYEHNSGEPYGPCWHREGGKSCDCDPCKEDWNEDGTPRWAITKVAYDGPFSTPCSGFLNSPYCVDDINAGAVAWLRTPQYSKPEERVVIQAGTTLRDFIRLVQRAGGAVYLPIGNAA